MSTVAGDHGPLLIRSPLAEVLGTRSAELRLLADSDRTRGAISANRTVLRQGAGGPPPHFHERSGELFFVLDGSLQALAGDQVLTLDRGDFLFVPQHTPHAFGATAGADADVLILFAPGSDHRFEYFRLADRVMKGQASPQEILDRQDYFDNYFLDSETWRAARLPTGGGPA